jgi:hypothetical protein
VIEISNKKIDVVIETINPDEPDVVVIREYDKDLNYVVETIIDECSRKEAFETYNVMGAISKGDLYLFDEEEEEFDYEMYSGTTISDDDDY